MTNTASTVDLNEVNKFSQLAEQWWSLTGPLKTLHDINPLRVAWIESHVSLKGLRVLDVGCGGGILSEAMARCGAEVTGLDMAQDALLVARSHAENQDLNINYYAQPIEQFAAEPFDVITCLEMLEHVTNPQEVITHCARLLKPDGYLFLSTLNRSLTAFASAIVAAEYVLNLLPRQTHDYNKFIKPGELAAMTRQAGFTPAALTGMSYNPLSGQAALCDSVAVNYLFLCRRF